MSRKILKLFFLLMIGVGTCIVPMLGFFPIAESYYSALCIVKFLPFVAWPIMVVTIFKWGGLLAAIKYGTMMATTGLCVSGYKKGAVEYNPYIAAVIVSIVATAVEAMDWAMNGMVKRELYGLVPIVMLTWSTTIIFTYFVKKVMYYYPRDKNYPGDYKNLENEKNEGMIRTSEAFKSLATEIKKMSAFERNQEIPMEGVIEREIEGNICRGCENGQIQYLERARLNYLWYNKMLETREAMAIQLNEMAKLLEYYTKPMYDETKVLFGMNDYLKHKLRERKILTRKISINENGKGRLEVRMMAKKKAKGDIKVELMENVVSEALGKKMRASKENIMDLREDFSQYCFFEEVNFMTISGTARRTREDEECSGDNFTVMEMNTGQTFMSICDGMGSGKKAKQYSEMIIDMLEHLSESGFSESTSLKLINSILLAGNQWQEPTAVDMALIDQYSGICQFLKLGAACTYIKRGSWVECIKSTSLPMGVFQEVDVEAITKKLYDGDFVIMISDGIVDALKCEDKEEAMGRLIMEINTSSPREMALHILSRTLAMTDGIPKDDMTVLCTGIWEKIGGGGN